MVFTFEDKFLTVCADVPSQGIVVVGVYGDKDEWVDGHGRAATKGRAGYVRHHATATVHQSDYVHLSFVVHEQCFWFWLRPAEKKEYICILYFVKCKDFEFSLVEWW